MTCNLHLTDASELVETNACQLDHTLNVCLFAQLEFMLMSVIRVVFS
jgi:hypothetical protein